MTNTAKTLLFFLMCFQLNFAQADYNIEINGKTFEIELNKDYEFEINNKQVKLHLKQKDTLVYNDETFSFKFPKEYKVAKNAINEGVEQLMLMSADGSGFIIQKYSTLNPTMLNELMLSEVTKESLNYGFEQERVEYERTLTSGKKIDVTKAILTYNDEVNIYEIASTGKKDSGLMIITMNMDDAENAIGTKLIQLIWDSLDIKP